MKTAEEIFLLVEYYIHGLYGFRKDVKKAISLLTKFVKDTVNINDLSHAYYILGCIYAVELNDVNKALSYWGKSVQLTRHSSALYNIGVCYLEGIGGLPKNVDQATRYLMEAANEGETEAIIAIAQCYFCGIGILPTASQLAKWLQQVADIGKIDLPQVLDLPSWSLQQVIQLQNSGRDISNIVTLKDGSIIIVA